MNVLIPYESTSGFINVEKSLRGILEKDYDSYIPVINNPVTNVNKKAYPNRVHRFKKIVNRKNGENMFEHSTAAKNIQVTTMEGNDAEALDALTNDWLIANKEIQVYNITFNNAEQPTVMIVHEPI